MRIISRWIILRTIEVPGGEVLELLGLLGEGTGLGPDVEARAADPDVLGGVHAVLRQAAEAF